MLPHVPSLIAFGISQAAADNDALAWAALSTITTNDNNPGGWGTGVGWGTGTGWGTSTTDDNPNDNSGGWGNGSGWGDGVGTGWGNTVADSSSSTGAATTSTSENSPSLQSLSITVGTGFLGGFSFHYYLMPHSTPPSPASHALQQYFCVPPTASRLPPKLFLSVHQHDNRWITDGLLFTWCFATTFKHGPRGSELSQQFRILMFLAMPDDIVAMWCKDGARDALPRTCSIRRVGQGWSDGDKGTVGVQDAGVWDGVAWHESNNCCAIPLTRVMGFLGLVGNASSLHCFVAAKGLPVLTRVKDFVFLGHVGGVENLSCQKKMREKGNKIESTCSSDPSEFWGETIEKMFQGRKVGGMDVVVYHVFNLIFSAKPLPMGRHRARAPEVNEDDPASIRRYNQWYSSHMYNSYNRDARNEKKEPHDTLRATQARESPDQVEARRLAARESARNIVSAIGVPGQESQKRRTMLKGRKERAVGGKGHVERERLAELASLPKVVSQARAAVCIDEHTDDEGGEDSDDGSDDAA
ncbi:hypothetical protein B0H13DRAFT_1885265 [Mycena leptocephala]|nr:hypothetical protein B0H13DRAFT_1885265 [Mycena leptocephala]